MISMIVNVNYIGSGGKWHIRKKSDLYAVHSLILGFCEENMPSWIDSCSRFKFEYSRELGLVSLSKCLPNSSIMLLSDEKVVSLRDNNDFTIKVRLLLDTIAAMGIVSAPFNSVDLLVDKNMSGVEDLSSSDYLVSSGCTGKNTGYYTLQGKLV